MRSPATPESRAESLIEALPYIQKFRGQTFVIKYGGAAMEEDQIVERFLRDIVFLEAVGINPVLVHGGGKAITARMRDAGLKARFVNGLRVTDESSIKIVEETLDNEINPKIVQTIIKYGGKAAGFSGKNVFLAKRMGPQHEGGSPDPIDIGFVGEAARINSRDVRSTIKGEAVPVISPIGADENGVVLNINADIAAAALAASLKASKLIYVSDVPGIMRNPAERDSLIPTMHASQVEALIKERVIEGGMIPKVQSAADALKNGVEKIHMIGGQTQHCLLLEIFTNAGIGTEIVA